jgi:hypothetical protein
VDNIYKNMQKRERERERESTKNQFQERPILERRKVEIAMKR